MNFIFRFQTSFKLLNFIREICILNYKIIQIRLINIIIFKPYFFKFILRNYILDNLNILIFQIFFIFHFIKPQNCLNIFEENIILNNNNDGNNFKITPGTIETKSLYKIKTPFTFFFSKSTN